jgi:hypothetical protein
MKTLAAKIICAVSAALLFAFATPAPAHAQSAASETAQCQSREGAGFISGEWRVTGGYADGASGVDFTVTFSPDGTFVDRDGYRGRWIISGGAFTMYYPDESQLGYIGVIQGGRISGRFDGLDTAGTFQMTQIAGGAK